jgi:hypothetical protein
MLAGSPGRWPHSRRKAHILYEYAELLTLADHTCAEPRLERLEVYEPVRMRWHWLTIFECCSHVHSEPSLVIDTPLPRPVVMREVAA